MYAADVIHSQVTGDGHGSRPFGNQPFSHQPPEPGCQLLVPSSPPAHRVLDSCPQPTIRSPYAAPFEHCLFPLSPCHHAHVPPRGFAALTFAQELRSDLHLCTILAPASGPLVFRVPLVPVSPCQHVPSRKRVSPCHRAHVSPRGYAAFSCTHPTNTLPAPSRAKCTTRISRLLRAKIR